MISDIDDTVLQSSITDLKAAAELYAEAAREFGDRILAIYIRDVDLELDTARGAAQSISGGRKQT